MNIHNIKLAMRSLGDATTIVGSFTVESGALGNEQSLLQSELSIVASADGIKLMIGKRSRASNIASNSVVDGLTDFSWKDANKSEYSNKKPGGSILLANSLLLPEEDSALINRFVFSSKIRNHGNEAIKQGSQVFSGRLTDENENVIVFDLKEEHLLCGIFNGESYRGMIRSMKFESSKGTAFYIDSDAIKAYREMIEVSLQDIAKEGHVRECNLKKLGLFNLKEYYENLDFINFSRKMAELSPLYLERSKRILTCDEHKEIEKIANDCFELQFS